MKTKNKLAVATVIIIKYQIIFAFILMSGCQLAVNNSNNTQDYNWVIGISGSIDKIANSIAVDSLGNSYITGNFYETVDFDPSVGVVNLTSVGKNDIFLAKYDNAGKLVFAKQMGGRFTDSGNSITVDRSGNSYITGSFYKTPDLVDGVNAYLSDYSNGSFLAKYDTHGNLIFDKKIGGSGQVVGNSIVVDDSGNSYITGYFTKTAYFDSKVGSIKLTSNGLENIFFAKYDPVGKLVFAKSMGAESIYDGYFVPIQASGNGITVDGHGNSYITGYFHGQVDFDSIGQTTSIRSKGKYDIFIAKYDTFGNFLFAKGMGGYGNDIGESIVVDASGNFYITGSFRGKVDFDPGIGIVNLTSTGSSDIFFAKYDTFGNLVFAKGIGGIDNDYAKSIALDGIGNSYITGYFKGMADFDPGVGTVILNSTVSSDIFLAKYDSVGNLVFAKGMGGGSDDEGKSLAVDRLGNIYITGVFRGIADFDSGVGTVYLTSLSGSSDIFITKYGNAP